MKVLISAIGVRGGGVETYLLGLLPELTKMSPEIDYTLVIPEKRAYLYNNILPENVSILTVPDKVLNSSIRRFIYEHITFNKFQINKKYNLHFRTDEMLSPFSVFLGIPTMIVCHHSTNDLFLEVMKGEGKLKVYYITLIKKIALKISGVAVTVSHYTKAELSGRYPFVFKKVQVIYHGVNHKVFNCLCDSSLKFPTMLRNTIGTNSYLLSISDRHHRKNFIKLIKAYEILVNIYHINEHLVIIGRAKSWNEENRLKKIISEVKLGNQVHLLDYIDQSKLPYIYRKASVYVFPSKYESFGLTLLEAMACGTPVACAQSSVMPEICGSNVLYFDPDDEEDLALKVYQILNNKSLKEKLIAKGIEYAKTFSWKKTAEKYLKIIKSFEKGKITQG